MNLPKWFPANRVAAIAAFLTGLAAALAGIESALPTAAANAVVSAVGVLGAIITALHFMTGSQKYDALTVPAAVAAVGAPPVLSPDATSVLRASGNVVLSPFDESGLTDVAEPPPSPPAEPGTPAEDILPGQGLSAEPLPKKRSK